VKEAEDKNHVEISMESLILYALARLVASPILCQLKLGNFRGTDSALNLPIEEPVRLNMHLKTRIIFSFCS